MVHENGKEKKSKGEEGYTNRRRLLILTTLNKEQRWMDYKELVKLCQDKRLVSVPHSMSIISNDIDSLIDDEFALQTSTDSKGNKKVRWFPSGVKVCFKGTTVGNNLNLHTELKEQIARKTLELLFEWNKDFNSLLLGTGSTVYLFLCEILKRFESAINHHITLYTNNLPVVCDVARSRKDIGIFINTGTYSRDSCSIINKQGIEELCRHFVDATVMSFNTIRYDAKSQHLVFASALDADGWEKREYLAATQSGRVFIPINIEGIGQPGGVDVADETNINRKREYIIVTNFPKTDEQKQRLDELKERIDKDLGLAKVIKVVETDPTPSA